MDLLFDVDVVMKDGTDKTITIDIDVDDFCMLEDLEDKIEYITKMAKETVKNIKDVDVDKDDLNGLENEIEDLLDTSDMHPNETLEDFLEHEDI